MKKMSEIKQILLDLNRDSINFERYTKDDKKKFYLISINWMKSFLNFFEKFINSETTEKLFERNKTLLQFFGEDDNTGYYPGPVNNFDIINFKEFLIDPNEQTVFLKKGIKENTDFVYVTEEEWRLIKDIFGYNFEIERGTATLSGELMIEVNLRNFKTLVICDRFETNMLYPKSVLISKQLTIKDLKDKIIRSCENIQPGIKEDKVRFLQFNFGLSERWKDTFELINAFAEGEKEMKIEATPIDNDSCLIEDFNFGPGDLIIVEISSDTEFIKLKTNESKCALCDKKTVTVEFCSYCSNVKYFNIV
jgi:hypothetical protein